MIDTVDEELKYVKDGILLLILKPTWDYHLLSFIPSKGVDNDKGYNPKNCIWIHQKYQPRNQSTNRKVTYRGKTQCLAAWAEEFGMRSGMLGARLKRGWELGEALNTPSLK